MRQFSLKVPPAPQISDGLGLVMRIGFTAFLLVASWGSMVSSASVELPIPVYLATVLLLLPFGIIASYIPFAIVLLPAVFLYLTWSDFRHHRNGRWVSACGSMAVVVSVLLIAAQIPERYAFGKTRPVLEEHLNQLATGYRGYLESQREGGKIGYYEVNFCRGSSSGAAYFSVRFYPDSLWTPDRGFVKDPSPEDLVDGREVQHLHHIVDDWYRYKLAKR